MPNEQRILIVDDTVENLTVLAEALKGTYHISIAKSAVQALNILDKGIVPDLIISDIMMPEMDGYTFLAEIKRKYPKLDMPFIFLTAITNEEKEFMGLNMGAVDYITKPVNIPLLKVRIKNHLSLKILRDDLENQVQERTKEVITTQRAMISSIGMLAEFRDPETGEHIQRTKMFVLKLADYISRNYNDVDLSPQDINALYNAAPLHDIGKIAIPDSILLKPAGLTNEEFEQMKSHTTYGYNAMKKVSSNVNENKIIQYAMEIALNHHEKWCGGGYPNNISGDAIPLSARIMSLSDVYDALRSKRPYKDALSHQEAFKIITEGDGRTSPEHFDPMILESFIAIHQSFDDITMKYSD